MTSGLLNASSTDFDSLFAAGQGNQLFYVYANDGTDVGQKYLPASYGTAASNCGFLNAAGEDIGPKLCTVGTNYTHTIYVGRYRLKVLWAERVHYGYGSGLGTAEVVGSVTPSTISGYSIYGMRSLSTDTGTLLFSLNGDTSFNNVYIKKFSTGQEVYMYKSGVSNNHSLFSVSSGSLGFSAGEVGTTIKLQIRAY